MPLRPALLLLLLTTLPGLAADDVAERALAILDRRCFECHSHSAGKNKGGLVMDASKGLTVGGDSGSALVAGKPDESLFIQRILSTDEDEMMPPKGDRLSAAEVTTIKAWVAAGAKWPASRAAKPVSGKYLPGRINDEDRSWWAYRPVVRPEVPAPALPSTGANPVDRFIDRRLAKEGLNPAPEAARASLIRRVTFDVTGLPPTPEEVEAFIKDTAPDAYERLVDRLLASRGFAERNARVWLDLVRYADSDGYRADDYRPTAWRYRDYVIRALQDNKPYDRFLQEQVAGDELFPGDPDALTGTGFLHHWIYEYNLRDARGQWTTILNDVTDTVGDALLGAGMQCARCHDHKFDPILQRDYFALRAFFSNILPVEDRIAWTKEEADAHAVKQAAWEKKTAAIREEIRLIEQPYRDSSAKKQVAMFPEDIQAMINKPESERAPLEAQLAALAWRQVDYDWNRLDRAIKGEKRTRLDDLRKQLSAFGAEKPADPPYVLAVREPARTASPVLLPKKETPVEPAFLSVLSPTVPAAPAVIPPAPEGVESSGRRAAFARWLTQPENPFTARLAMNRLWQQYFRRGLTPHASDFGRLGEPPSHPELLDWLSSEFVRLGWDVKAMHRLVLTSAAYRRSSEHPDPSAGRTKDPLNVLIWRFQPQRLEAEQIRDALFAACGDLDAKKQGGEGALFSEPVRSVYTRAIRNNRDPLMEVFDAPEWFNSSSGRPVTTTPIQSLLLLNSPFMLKRGEALARRLKAELPGGTPEQRVARAYAVLYSRAPSAKESARGAEFIRTNARPAPAQAAVTASFNPEKIPNRDGQAARLEMDHRTPFVATGTEGLDFSKGFTVEAVIVPRSVSDSGALRVIAAKGTGGSKESYWQLGITGLRSRRAPMVLALQAYGTLQDGSFGEAVHFSGLRIEMNKPYFVSAAVRYATAESAGEVTFAVKDLANDDEPLLIDKVPSSLAALPANPHPVSLGGRASSSPSGFHGALDDVRLSSGPLGTGDLLFTSEDPSPRTMGFWRFENKSGVMSDSSGRSHPLSIGTPAAKSAKAESKSAAKESAPLSPEDRALAAFCHALLNASEFLYVE